MSALGQCSACDAKFRFPAERLGQAARCPNCKSEITLSAADEFLAALAAGPPVERAPAASKRTAQPRADRALIAAKPGPIEPPALLRMPQRWTAWDWVLIKTAIACIAMGVLANILPTIGFQFRKLNQLGAAAPAAGWGLAGVGGFMIAYVVALRGRMFMLIGGTIALSLLAIAGLLVVGYLSSGNPPRSAMNPTPTPPAHAAPGYLPPPPAKQPVRSYDEYCRRYGENRVVRVQFVGGDGESLRTRCSETVKTVISDARANSWSFHKLDDVFQLLAAPVDDFDAATRAFAWGAAIEADRTRRVITVRMAPIEP